MPGQSLFFYLENLHLKLMQKKAEKTLKKTLANPISYKPTTSLINPSIGNHPATLFYLHEFTSIVLPFFQEVIKNNFEIFFKAFYSFSQVKNKNILSTERRSTSLKQKQRRQLKTNKSANPVFFF